MGFFFSLLSSATFGLIPLFSLPLMAQGLSPATVLFYRFFIATIVLGILLLLRGERFHTSGRNLLKLAGMSLMYSLAALLFMQAFKHLPSGVVATLHFSYPVMVMLIMIAFFHERFSTVTAIAITLAIAGVYLLGNGEATGANGAGFAGMSMLGLTLALVSALCNSLYITSIYTAGLTNITGLMLTFYVMAFGALCSLINSLATNSFQLLTSWRELLLAVLLALVTAVLSNFTLILAVQRIGSTLASVLGVMEPVTAVIVGILVFNEPFSLPLVMGIALIGSSVVLIMLGEHIRQLMTKRKAAKQTGASSDKTD
ncbi:EamA family transporter [Desulfovibrio intestinalis]|uniref:Drug/metabolite transporter (DMT)-like permease n=1 Tax=Desulfovibrio intestinalis TaxID=58621 RepID=A0A7W8FET2_9BACT|nr:DMT family transporter [Desulfovibrio intestinalis]MBB5143133.1 drug/metabolite transporter (DMT)-like permease [Desulfovibrio intestinalis]